MDEKFEKFSLCTIQNIRPKGFGDNHNSAFSAYDSDFFFIVNPDIFAMSANAARLAYSSNPTGRARVSPYNLSVQGVLRIFVELIHL